MKHIAFTTLMLVGPLLWTIVVIMPALAASDKKLPGQFSGNASWYGAAFNGKKTASGEIFNMNKLTGAHRRLPMPTKVLVENPRTGNAVVIRVNDRGPYVKNRVMDLSREGAKQIGILSMGVGYIECMVLPPKQAISTASKVPAPGVSGVPRAPSAGDREESVGK